jgi:methionine-gamma-lyase
MSFDVKDGTCDSAYRVLDAVHLCHLAVSLGGTEALIEHPRSMTHSDMTREDLDRCGITEAMIRLSVGLESSDDVIQDLCQALEKA